MVGLFPNCSNKTKDMTITTTIATMKSLTMMMLPPPTTPSKPPVDLDAIFHKIRCENKQFSKLMATLFPKCNEGADEGGWKQALEMQLDLEVAANKRLNKMAWCYLTLMFEGDALDEMDMIPDKNAYEVWHYLKSKYEPRKEKAHDYLEMKIVQCGLESLKEVNAF